MNDSNTSMEPNGSALSDEDIKREMKKAVEAGITPLVTDEEGKPLDFEIKDRELLRPSCVDLRVGKIYPPGKGGIVVEGENEVWKLPPGAIVHIQSKERINTPTHIMGLLAPRNSKSEKGLLMLNAGHVDPYWQEGFLTAEVMNVTIEERPIKIGEPFFSVIFQYMRTPTKISTGVPDKVREEKALLMAATRAKSLHEYYMDEVQKRLSDYVKDNYATKTDVSAGRMLFWTALAAFIGALAALAAGIYLGIWLWQHLGPLPTFCR